MRAAEVKKNTPVFRNPTSWWKHEGSYSVKLRPGTSTEYLPSTFRVSGNIIYVDNGIVKETRMKGIEFESQGQVFSYGYKVFIEKIKDSAGNLLWQNPD